MRWVDARPFVSTVTAALLLLLTSCGPRPVVTSAPSMQAGKDYVFFAATEANPFVKHPMHWQDCQTITWAYNPKGQLYDARADASDAFKQLSQEVGLRFRYVGTTGDVPFSTDSTANIIVGWVVPEPGGPDWQQATGLGGPNVVSGDLITSGALKLNPTHTQVGRTEWRVTVFHELGHVMGLGHTSKVPDASEVMNAGAGGDVLAKRGYGPGDLAGFRALYPPCSSTP